VWPVDIFLKVQVGEARMVRGEKNKKRRNGSILLFKTRVEATKMAND